MQCPFFRYSTNQFSDNDYAFAQHFADSSTHEAHHLIPQKLLIITGILKVSEGPSIRMEKKDHQLTRSYKRRDMLKNDFFRKQQEYLEALNIREAVEMEIADIQAKFGSKYDDAISVSDSLDCPKNC